MAALRVTFVNPLGEVGGAERSLLLLLEGIDRSRYAPRVICFASGPFLEALERIDVPAEVVAPGGVERWSRFGQRGGAAGLFLPAVGSVRAIRRLLAALRRDPPDLIHTNGLKAHFLAGLCGRWLRTPVVWHVRDLLPPGRARALLRAAADWLPSRIIANSGAVAAQFAGRRAAARTHVVHNAVDVARFRPERPREAVRASLNVPAGATLLAMVAHFTPWKGHPLFLEVMARLVREGRFVRGVIVGGGIYRTGDHAGYEAEVRERCRRAGLDGHVTFAGFQNCVADFLNAADMLVHPPTRPEPFGRAVIEAMALGKPVVAAAAGGVPEIVEPDVTGLLVPPGDAGAFAAAVRRLLDHPELGARMGRLAAERVRRCFDAPAHVARIQALYDSLEVEGRVPRPESRVPVGGSRRAESGAPPPER